MDKETTPAKLIPEVAMVYNRLQEKLDARNKFAALNYNGNICHRSI